MKLSSAIKNEIREALAILDTLLSERPCHHRALSRVQDVRDYLRAAMGAEQEELS